MHGLLPADRPINWDCDLNRGLEAWYLALPGQPRGLYWRDLAKWRHGTLTNMDPGSDWQGPRGRTGGYGCLDFDGSNDYVATGWEDDAIANGSPITIGAWVRPDAVDSTFQALMETWNNNHGYLLWVSNNNAYRFQLDVTALMGTTTAVAGQWAQVVGTYDGATMRIYVNGQEEASVGKVGAILGGSSTTLRIGGNSAGGGDPWDGLLDDVFVQYRCLSAFEVRSRYEESRQGYPNALLWYPRRRVFDLGGGAAPGGSPLLLRLQNEGLFVGSHL